MRRSNREILLFFGFICQFMVAYMLYAIMKLATTNENRSPNEDRAIEGGDILLTFSYLGMLYGVSTSVRKTLDRMAREDSLRSEGVFEEADSDEFHKIVNATSGESTHKSLMISRSSVIEK